MPEGRTDSASWDGGGKHSYGIDSGLVAALMASCSAVPSKHSKGSTIIPISRGAH